MNVHRNVIALVAVLVSAMVWAVDPPQLVTQRSAAPGTLPSSSDAFGAPRVSPVLDSGDVLFLTGEPFFDKEDEDRIGSVDVYRSSSGSISFVSLGFFFSEWLGANAEGILASSDGTVGVELRYADQFDLLPTATVLHLGSVVTRTAVDGEPKIEEAALSGDGSRLVFTSAELTSGNVADRVDLYHYSITAQSFTLVVSAAVPSSPSVSADGNVIVFVANGSVLVHSVSASTTTSLKSVTGNSVTRAVVSGDGAWVVFCSAENGLVAGDADDLSDVFIVRTDGTSLEQVSVSSAGSGFDGAASPADQPAASADGRFVTFVGGADGASARQVWLRDRASVRTQCLSASATAEKADSECAMPAVSANGRYVTFSTAATNLFTPSPTVRQIYLVDRGANWLDISPLAPGSAWTDDTADVVGWDWVDGYASASDYEVSLDGGATWTAATSNPFPVGDVDIASGLILIRVRETGTNAVGDALVLSDSFSQGSVEILWSMAIGCSTLSASAAFGMAAELVEVPGTVPEAGQPGICLLDSESAGLSTQLLVSADEAEWLFVVRSPADMSTEWTWSLPATLPVDRYLSLWEIDSVGAPVGGTALDLAQTTSLLVPAGEERLLVVRYAADRTVDIALHEGWNLVSLPVAPVSGVLSEVFAEEGEPVVASSGYVWADGGYATVDEVSPLVGAWVYALRDAQLLVRGAVVSTSEMALVAGWNIVGVANPTEAAGLMAAGSLPGGFMTWDPTVRRYWWAEMLVPGSGYWVRSASAQSVPLGSSARRGL